MSYFSMLICKLSAVKIKIPLGIIITKLEQLHWYYHRIKLQLQVKYRKEKKNPESTED